MVVTVVTVVTILIYSYSYNGKPHIEKLFVKNVTVDWETGSRQVELEIPTQLFSNNKSRQIEKLKIAKGEV